MATPSTNTASHAAAEVDDWSVDRATSLPEVWANIATHLWTRSGVATDARVQGGARGG